MKHGLSFALAIGMCLAIPRVAESADTDSLVEVTTTSRFAQAGVSLFWMPLNGDVCQIGPSDSQNDLDFFPSEDNMGGSVVVDVTAQCPPAEGGQPRATSSARVQGSAVSPISAKGMNHTGFASLRYDFSNGGCGSCAEILDKRTAFGGVISDVRFVLEEGVSVELVLEYESDFSMNAIQEATLEDFIPEPIVRVFHGTSFVVYPRVIEGAEVYQLSGPGTYDFEIQIGVTDQLEAADPTSISAFREIQWRTQEGPYGKIQWEDGAPAVGVDIQTYWYERPDDVMEPPVLRVDSPTSITSNDEGVFPIPFTIGTAEEFGDDQAVGGVRGRLEYQEELPDSSNYLTRYIHNYPGNNPDYAEQSGESAPEDEIEIPFPVMIMDGVSARGVLGDPRRSRWLEEYLRADPGNHEITIYEASLAPFGSFLYDPLYYPGVGAGSAYELKIFESDPRYGTAFVPGYPAFYTWNNDEDPSGYNNAGGTLGSNYFIDNAADLYTQIANRIWPAFASYYPESEIPVHLVGDGMGAIVTRALLSSADRSGALRLYGSYVSFDGPHGGKRGLHASDLLLLPGIPQIPIIGGLPALEDEYLNNFSEFRMNGAILTDSVNTEVRRAGWNDFFPWNSYNTLVNHPTLLIGTVSSETVSPQKSMFGFGERVELGVANAVVCIQSPYCAIDSIPSWSYSPSGNQVRYVGASGTSYEVVHQPALNRGTIVDKDGIVAAGVFLSPHKTLGSFFRLAGSDPPDLQDAPSDASQRESLTQGTKPQSRSNQSWSVSFDTPGVHIQSQQLYSMDSGYMMVLAESPSISVEFELELRDSSNNVIPWLTERTTKDRFRVFWAEVSPGSYSLNVLNPTGNLFAVNGSVNYPGGPYLSFSGQLLQVEPGTTMTVGLSLVDENGAALSADDYFFLGFSVLPTSGQFPSVVQYNDIGVAGDLIAGDLKYSGQHQIPAAEGELYYFASAGMAINGGTTFIQRDSQVLIPVRASGDRVASLSSSISVDIDANSLIDRIEVPVTVETAAPGEFTLTAEIEGPIATVPVSVDVDAPARGVAPQVVNLPITAQQLRRAGIDGSFMLKNLSLIERTYAFRFGDYPDTMVQGVAASSLEPTTAPTVNGDSVESVTDGVITLRLGGVNMGNVSAVLVDGVPAVSFSIRNDWTIVVTDSGFTCGNTSTIELSTGSSSVLYSATPECEELTTSCPADLDGNGITESFDLSIILAFWGQSGTVADLDGDGVVGSFDLAALIAAWGPCP